MYDTVQYKFLDICLLNILNILAIIRPFIYIWFIDDLNSLGFKKYLANLFHCFVHFLGY